MIPNDQIERLAGLSEEASEVIKAAAKILRHGTDREKSKNNIRDLENEIGDFEAWVALNEASGDISRSNINKSKEAKLRKFLGSDHTLHYQSQETLAKVIMEHLKK